MAVNDQQDTDGVPCSSGNGGVMNETLDLTEGKSVLKIPEFQIDCVTAVKQGKDVIVVQPTGLGKFMCFVIPALPYEAKGFFSDRTCCSCNFKPDRRLEEQRNFHEAFQGIRDEPLVAFCTPEYLFGSKFTGTCLGTVGQFSTLLAKKDCIGVITIDEAHKIFDRLPKYHPVFNDLKKQKEISCPIIAMSATLTNDQIAQLQQDFLRSSNTVTFKKAVNRGNHKLQLQLYKRSK